MAKRLTKREKELMERHRLAPGYFPQREIMKKLKLGRDYQKFYRLFYRATVMKD